MAEQLTFFSKSIFLFLLGIILGIGLGYLVIIATGKRNLKDFNVSFKDGELKIDMKTDNSIDIDTLLNQLWSNGNHKRSILGYLNSKDVWSFEEDYQGSLIARIKKIKPDESIAHELVALKNEYLGPFRMNADSCIVSNPDSKIPIKTAYTWAGNNKYIDHKILITTEGAKGQITVTCRGNSGGYQPGQPENLFQLNKVDMQELLGTDKVRMAKCYVTAIERL